MKNFGFSFNISGNATIEVKAETLEEVIEILQGKKEEKVEPEYILEEWNLDLPYAFSELGIGDVKKYLSYEDEE